MIFQRMLGVFAIAALGSPLWAAPAVPSAFSTSSASAVSDMQRYPSPSGRYDVVFVPLPKDWTHTQKAVPGTVRQTRELYAVTFYPARSNQPLNVMYYADEGAPPAPESLLRTLLWSPDEKFVVMSDKVNARENNHVFQLVAPLERHQAWRLECDHVRWVDDSRLVCDINTPEVPGGMLFFDGTVAKAELLVTPEGSFGYQIVSVSGDQVLLKQVLHEPADTKVKWDPFEPACISVNLDARTKKSALCPKE